MSFAGRWRSLSRWTHAIAFAALTWAFIRITLKSGYVEGMWMWYGFFGLGVPLMNKGASIADKKFTDKPKQGAV